MNLYVVWISLLLLATLGYLYRRKRAKSKVVRIVDNSCTGCGRCLKMCRRKALDTVEDETGKHIVVKEPDKCTGCGKCVAVCKFNTLEIANRE